MPLQPGQVVELGERQLRERVRGRVAHLTGDARQAQPSAHERFGAVGLAGQLAHVGAQVEEPLIAVGLLHGRQVAALAVLHQHQLAFRPLVHVAYDARHALQTGEPARGQAPVADDHAVDVAAACLVVGGDHELLLQPLGADAVGQLPHVAHAGARVVGVGDEVVDGDVRDGDAHWCGSLLLGRARPAPGVSCLACQTALVVEPLPAVLALAHLSPPRSRRCPGPRPGRARRRWWAGRATGPPGCARCRRAPRARAPRRGS